MKTDRLNIRNIKANSKLIYAFLWMALGVIHFLLLYLGYEVSGKAALADSFIFNLLFALIGAGLWYMVRYSDLQARSFWELAIYHISGAGVTLFAWLGLSYLVLNNTMRQDFYFHAFLKNTLTFRIVTGVLYYTVLVTIYYLIINFRELRERSQREAKLTGLLKEAELNMLRSQIRPHFLFNSLNSISSLTMTDPEKAQEMVIKLSEFMRYSLSFTDSMMSTLEKELYHVELYLDIEKVRFGQRLVFEKKIQPGSENFPVPVMILQPLIENCVKYGVYATSEPTRISLAAALQAESLEIKVGNTFDPEAKVKKGTGTGLKNIQARLLNLYGTSSLMKIQPGEDYFEIVLSIPKDVR